MQARAQAGGVGRQVQFAAHALEAQPLRQRALQQVDALPVAGGNPHALAAHAGAGRLALVHARVGLVVARGGTFDAVDLVEHQHLRQVAGTDFLQHLVDLGDALLAVRIGGVDDVQQQVGLARFAQGGAERGDEFVRQVAHETHRIGQHHRAAGQVDAAHGGVERGEQLVGRIGLGTGQHVEQRGLAGVGVAHQGHARQFAAHAGTAHLGALHFDFFQPLLQLLDALLQQAAIGFQLRLTGAAQADGTAALALQVGPAADQARGHVAQLRQFHLQLAFVAARALGEDVQDQAGAVQHAALQEFLQIAFLAGREREVDQHQVGAGRVGGRLHFLQLAAADQRGGIGTVDARGQQRGDAGAGRARQVAEFLGQAVVGTAAGMRLDQQRMLALAGSFKQWGRASSIEARIITRFRRRCLPPRPRPAARSRHRAPRARCAPAPPWRWRACRPSG